MYVYQFVYSPLVSMLVLAVFNSLTFYPMFLTSSVGYISPVNPSYPATFVKFKEYITSISLI